MTVRELNGWSPRTVTVDDEGNVLSVTVTEPRFSQRQVALLLASRRKESERRGSHGHLMSDATDPANQFGFEVDGPDVDWAQESLNKFVADYKKRYPNADMDSRLFRVRKKD